MKLTYNRQALAQLDEIVVHIAENDPGTAAAVARRIKDLVSLIARHPMIGRSTDLENVRVFRAAPYPYLIFYRLDVGRGSSRSCE
jgi:plasmid stabilization system protein ParE